MRASAGLAIEPHDLDDAHEAIGAGGGATERFRINPGSPATSPADTYA